MLFNRKVLAKVMDYMDDRESIVIQGARQVGKTSIMKLIMQELQEKGIIKERLIYMDLEDFKLLKICNEGEDSLLNYIGFKYGGKEKVYLFCFSVGSSCSF